MPVASPPIHDAAPAEKPAVDWTGIAKILCLVVLGCLCYWPALRGGFLWDDDLLISHNPLVQSPGGLWRIWFSTEPYDFFPLTYTSFWLEWPLWGSDPLGYRVVNLLLHLSSAFLFWRLLVRLRVPGAWFGALLFTVHPLNVASVAWIAERKNTLSMVFYLASLLCWVESEEPSTHRKQVRWYVSTLGIFVLAALSKSSVVMLPCVLLLLIWWRRGNLRLGDLRRTFPFFIVSLAAGLLTVWFQLNRSMDPHWMRTAESPVLRVLIATRSILFYLGKTLVPMRLSMVYPRWEMSVASAWNWLPLVGVVSLLVAAWWCRTRWGRGPFTALGYFVLTVLPVSGLIPMTFSMYSFVSDHFVYVPLLGPLAGLAAGLAFASEHGGIGSRRAVVGAMVLITGLFVVASVRRADEFSSSRRLWESTLAVNPACAIAHNNLGLAIQDEGRLSDAETHFRRALELDPALMAAATNLAGVLQRESRWRESAAAYVKALNLFPDAKDFNNYGVVLLQLGEVDLARAQFQSAVKLQPDLLSAHFNLHKAALARRDDVAAAEDLRECLRIDPDDVPSLLALAALGIKTGAASPTEAVALAERASRLTRGMDAVALGTLSRAYLSAGRRGDAISAGEQAQTMAVRHGQAESATEIGRYLDRLRGGP